MPTTISIVEAKRQSEEARRQRKRRREIEAFERLEEARKSDWMPVLFGKYEKKSLPQIALKDPGYVNWGIRKKVFRDPPELPVQAAQVFQRGSRIALPADRFPDHEVEYVIDSAEKKLVHVNVVPRNTPVAANSRRLPVFDLFLAGDLDSWDKSGGKIIIRAIKRFVLGDEKYQFTRDRAEDFFSDDSNLP